MAFRPGKQILSGSLAVILAAVPVWAQEAPAPAPKPAEQQALVLRSTTRLVQVSVIVHGKNNEPVTDLKKEDFTLLDNGKPQSISVFSEQSMGTLPHPEGKLPPNVFTNSFEQRAGTPSSVTVILLDGLNTRWQDQAYARNAVVKFLQQLHPEDRIAIYTLGRGLRILHDFTTDSAELLTQLQKYNGQNLPDLGASEQNSFGTDEVRMLDGFLNGRGGGSGAEADFYTINRVRGTLRAIEFIADHLSSLPGRKNLVWVSGGFPQQINFDGEAFRDPSRQQENFADDIDRTVRAVNNANLAIYPVDARGLVTDPAFSAENRSVKLDNPDRMKHVVDNQMTMNELASRTGGRAFYNTNDLKNAVRSAIEDSKVTYTLGFYPDDDKYDGKFHKINVKVARSGLSVRFRKGYLDGKERPLDEKVRQADLHDAVWSPMDATGIGISMAVRPDPDTNKLGIAIQVDPKSLNLEQVGDRHNGRLDLLFIQKDSQGHQFNGVDSVITLQLTPEKYKLLMEKGLFYQQIVDRSFQANQLRVIVRDAASGTMGSLTVPFKQLVSADKMIKAMQPYIKQPQPPGPTAPGAPPGGTPAAVPAPVTPPVPPVAPPQ